MSRSMFVLGLVCGLIGLLPGGCADYPDAPNEEWDAYDGGTPKSMSVAQCVAANENATATLSCASGHVIGEIELASYGTPTGTTCATYATGTCHAQTSKSKVEALCLNRQTCSVVAKNPVFGDPCAGKKKRLAVRYTCKPQAPSGSSGSCTQVSERGTASLTCPAGQVIRTIDFASYGTPTGSCPNFAAGTCHATSSKSKVEGLCLNRQACTFAANNVTFGDPCAGTPKRLAVRYTCGETQAPQTTSGLRHSAVSPLPGNEPTACEWDWTVRQLHYMPDAIVPRRMYFSSCKTQTENPEMFVSMSVGRDAGQGVRDSTSGALVRARLSPSTGALVPVTSRHFPECLEMHGIATSSDCTTVAALCRIPSGTSGADKDSLATHPSAAWMTQPHVCGNNNKKNDEMWLYEWKNGDIQSPPKRYIVHKAIGSWEYGNNYLRYGESDNTYAIAVKATVGSGNCHEADAFLVLNRADYSMTNRGWPWACGTGHTNFNRPAFDPTTGKYAMLCSTDFNEAKVQGLGSLYFRMENGKAQELHPINLEGLKKKGGASTLLPRPEGGFIGVLVGVDGEVKPKEYPLNPPTSIGMVQFAADGTMQGGIRWVVKNAGAYVGHPQLVSLGNAKYLLGWGVMKKLNDPSDTTDKSYRIPWEYYVVEIDSTGRRLTEPTLVQGAGWGEQDQLVSLGNGRAAWAYIPDPTLKSGATHPSCNADSLQLSVYTSRAP